MAFFCLLWIPLFYLFRRSLVSVENDGIVWALPLGIVNTVLQYNIGALISPGGFGLFRWFSGFIDIVCLPALIPLVVCLLLVALRALPSNVDITGFILLWLIPLTALRSVQWFRPGIPDMLVSVPLLWTALAAGIPVFIGCAKKISRWYVVIPCALGIALLPPLAATSWWLFYCQQKLYGFLFLTAALIPVTVWVIAKSMEHRAISIERKAKEDRQC